MYKKNLTIDFLQTFKDKLNFDFSYDGKQLLSDSLFKEILFQNFADKNLRRKIQKYIVNNPSTPETVIQSVFNVFSITRAYSYFRIFNAYNADYDPISNYDRTEEITRKANNTADTNTTTNDNADISRNGNNENTETRSDKITADSETTTKNTDNRETNVNTDMTTDSTESIDTTQTSNQSDTHNVSAYNSPQGFQPKEQTATQGSAMNVGTNTTNTTQQGDVKTNDTDSFSGNVKGVNNSEQSVSSEHKGIFSDTEETKRNIVTDSNSTENRNETESIRAFGNIGITTNQMMISSEKDLRQYNIYKAIVEEFSSLIGLYSYGG